LEEAIKSESEMIISYHPPIFHPFKRLTTQNSKERIILKAIENKIAIYSPHTALDSVSGGVNDWLASGLGNFSKISVIEPYSYKDPNQACKLVVFVPLSNIESLRDELFKIDGIGKIGNYSSCSFSTQGEGTFLGNEESNPTIGSKEKFEKFEEVKLEIVCNKSKLIEVSSTIKKFHSYETPSWEIFPLESIPQINTGQGRLVTLAEEVEISTLIERIKKHLQLSNVRVALPQNSNLGLKKKNQNNFSMCWFRINCYFEDKIRCLFNWRDEPS